MEATNQALETEGQAQAGLVELLRSPPPPAVNAAQNPHPHPPPPEEPRPRPPPPPPHAKVLDVTPSRFLMSEAPHPPADDDD